MTELDMFLIGAGYGALLVMNGRVIKPLSIGMTLIGTAATIASIGNTLLTLTYWCVGGYILYEYGLIPVLYYAGGIVSGSFITGYIRALTGNIGEAICHLLGVFVLIPLLLLTGCFIYLQ